MNYFVTGTDTDCGKTYVTALLVEAARAAGMDAVAAKPFCCGPREDVIRLAAASGGAEPLDAINPVWRKTPAAPRACELLGEPAADVPRALAGVRALASRHAQVFCEGAGGWLVPVTRDLTVADFAVQLGWPVIVVVRNKLGALNHSLLTIEAIRARSLPLAGVILNNADGISGEAAATNRTILEELIGGPVLAEVQRGDKNIGILEQLI